MKNIKHKIHNLTKKVGNKIGVDLPYYLKNGFWMSGGQLITMMSAFVVSLFFTHFLTKEIYGQYQLLITYVQMFAFISIPGLSVSILRSVASGKHGVLKEATQIRMKYSLFAIPVFLGLSAYFFFYKNNSITAVALLVVAFLFFSIHSYKNWAQYYQGRSNFKAITIANTVFSAVQLLFFFIATYFFPSNVLFIFFVHIGTQIVFNYVMSHFAKRNIENTLQQEGWREYGFFLTKINVLNTVTNKLDYILVGSLINVEALAIYAIGIQTANMLQNAFKTILMTTTPKIVNLKKIRFATYFMIFIITAIISAVLILILPFAMQFVYPDKFTDSIYLSQIVIAFIPAYVINNIYEKYIKFSIADKKVLLYVNIIFPIINLLSMFLFIYFFDIVGLAISYGLRSLLKSLIYKIISYSQINRSKENV